MLPAELPHKAEVPINSTFVNVIGPAPKATDKNDYRGAILVTSIVLIVCTTVAVGARVIRSWQTKVKLAGHDRKHERRRWLTCPR